jgi:hypothetical protein
MINLIVVLYNLASQAVNLADLYGADEISTSHVAEECVEED